MPSRSQIGDIRLHDALEQRRDQQELDGERLAGLGVDEHAILDLVAGLFQKLTALRKFPRKSSGLLFTGLVCTVVNTSGGT